MSSAENSLSPAGAPVPTGSLIPCVGATGIQTDAWGWDQSTRKRPRGDLPEQTRSKICFFLRQHAFSGL